ncbi:DUF1302 domain-containing protein [Roseiterribacter gracilis]|uniref:DUF1302 domain-containing protein n=1 Tax=Roseiterribacter gracilis TaxID=2812848 RepID=A0A8S8XG12_9PROT|nr:hypothetical protein TMPK1_22870 [Rhodospirillales bacterium TMPK1]
MPFARLGNQRFCAALALIVGFAAPATSATLETGSDVTVRWDTTVLLSTLLQPGKAALNLRNYCGGTAATAREHDCTYGEGLRRGRIDLTTSLDLSAGSFGAHVGVSSWYDAVDRQYESNGLDPSAHGGQAIEFAETYLRGEFDLAGDRVSTRVGRQLLVWGETLFATSNGIAAAQAPVDLYRPQTHGAYGGADSFLPVNQISVNWQRADGWSVEAYAQLEWRRSRIDPHDAYAGASDVLGAEGNRAFALDTSDTTTPVYTRLTDHKPRDIGQFGVALRGQIANLDVGFYAIRYDAKTPTVLIQPGRFAPASYRLDYVRGIELYGLSVAGPLGEAGVGFELSARRGVPLVNGGIALPAGTNIAIVAPRSIEPIGDALQAQFSWLQKLSPSSLFFNGADWSGEITANQLLSRNNVAQLRNFDRTKFAASIRTVLAPHIFQALPHLDLSLPFGAGYNFVGLSSIDPTMNRGTGDLSAGIRADFEQAWRAELTFTHYFGRVKNDTTGLGIGGAPQRLSNWDSIQITLQRSF